VLFDGQVLSGFAHDRDAALYEELAYSDDDSLLSGTLPIIQCQPPASKPGASRTPLPMRSVSPLGAVADATTGRRARLAKGQMFDLGRS
jgi:hypothetical protein